MGAGHAHALYVHEHSPIHGLAPETKVAAVVLFVVAAAVTPREAVWAFGVYALLLAIMVIVGRIPRLFFLSRLAGVLPFILFAFLVPFVGTGERVDLGWFEVSRDGLWAAWGIIAKATIGAGASIVLVATTEVPGILRGMRMLKVPAVIVGIAGFMIRYLELIADELGRMRQAMVARGHDARWIWQARPVAAAAGSMFVRAYERGERVHSAMAARGYTGEMPAIGAVAPSGRAWMAALSIPAVAVVMAAVALVTT
jgi:cobalt/nickel transport system permease protein